MIVIVAHQTHKESMLRTKDLMGWVWEEGGSCRRMMHQPTTQPKTVNPLYFPLQNMINTTASTVTSATGTTLSTSTTSWASFTRSEPPFCETSTSMPTMPTKPTTVIYPSKKPTLLPLFLQSIRMFPVSTDPRQTYCYSVWLI